MSSLNSREASTLRESPEADLQFVGRESELSKLLKLVEESLGSSKGDIAFISGEAGIGKTRLAQELKKRVCGQSNVRYLAAKSMRGESLSPYTPWIEFIREFVSEANVQLFYKVCAGDVNQIVRLVPELASAAQVTPASLASSPESAGAERLLFFKSISQFFTRLSEESPVLFLLDDAQWADRASIDLLDYFITNALGDHPIFILCLFRDNELESVEGSPLSTLIANLKRRSPDSIIHLRRLDSLGVRALTDLSLAQGRASDDLVRVIQQTSGGNPFFLLQIVRSLVEGERIFRATDGTWQRKPDASIQIPPAVKSVIRERLGSLRADTRNILSVASVVGEVFELGTLRAVAQNHTEESLLLGLKEAVRSSFIVEGFSAIKTYAFQDEAVRDVALEELSTEQRKRLHQKVGQALEQFYGNRADEHSAELAGHFIKGWETKKAIQYSFKAGERAGAVYAHEVAAKHFKNSLQLLKPGEDLSMRAQMLEKLSDEVELFGEIEDALRWLDEAAEIFEKIGEKKRAGGSYRKLAYMSLLSFEHHDNTLPYFKKALSILEKEPPSPELAYLYSDIGVDYIWRGDWERVAEWSNKSLRLSRELKYLVAESLALQTQCFVLPPNEKNEARKLAREALNLALAANSFWEASYAHFRNAMICTATEGASEESVRLFLEAIEYSRRVGYATLGFWNRSMLVFDAYLPLGRWLEARKIAEEDYAMFRRLPTRALSKIIASATLGHVLLYQGELEESEELLKTVYTHTKGYSCLELDLPIYTSLGRLYLIRGDHVQAERYLSEGYELDKKRGRVVVYIGYVVSLLSTMVELDIASGKPPAVVASRLRELKDAVAQARTEWALAYLRRAEGLFAVRRRDWNKAIDSLKESVAIFKRIGWAYDEARSKYELAMAYSRGGDIKASAELLNQALETFSAIGAKLDILKVVDAKKSLEEKLNSTWLPKFGSAESEELFEFLVSEFSIDHSAKKLEADKCGWRTLSDISKRSSISKHLLYGSNGEYGSALRKLLQAGLVETRSFQGERGRGGEVLRVRIAQGTDGPLKHYISKRIRQNSLSSKRT